MGNEPARLRAPSCHVVWLHSPAAGRGSALPGDRRDRQDEDVARLARDDGHLQSNPWEGADPLRDAAPKLDRRCQRIA
ncbi:MAG: hypothetical protein C4343_06155 [Chloroflexota bacterium]